MTADDRMEITQQELIDRHEWDVLVIMDAGRADDFEEVAPEAMIADDTLEHAYNGGYGYTASWFEYHFPDEYDAQFFSGGQPIHSMLATDYDERDHFREVIPHDDFEWETEIGTCLPEEAARVVREHYDGGRAVIRFICPHPPFPSEETLEYTRTKTRVRKTKRAITAGEVNVDQLRADYRNYYAHGLSVLWGLLGTLEGQVVVTADHGELFGERGYYYHGQGYPDVDALTTVPWAVIPRKQLEASG